MSKKSRKIIKGEGYPALVLPEHSNKDINAGVLKGGRVRSLLKNVIDSIDIDNNLQWQVGDLIQHYKDDTVLKIVGWDGSRGFSIALPKNNQPMFHGSQEFLEGAGYSRVIEN